MEYAKTGSGADKKTGTKIAKVWPKRYDHDCLLRLHLDSDMQRQGDGRFVITAKGAKIMLSFKSAFEELAEVLENANKEETAFPVTSFKVRCFTHCLHALASCHTYRFRNCCLWPSNGLLLHSLTATTLRFAYGVPK